MALLGLLKILIFENQIQQVGCRGGRPVTPYINLLQAGSEGGCCCCCCCWTCWPPSEPTQQLADAQLSLWWQGLAAAAAVRISAGSFASRVWTRISGAGVRTCVVESVPVPGRPEAIVGPSGRHVYSCQGAHRTSAEDQTGWVGFAKKLFMGGKWRPKGLPHCHKML